MRSLAFIAKSAVKVLLFDELTKYLVKFFDSSKILTYQCGKINQSTLFIRACARTRTLNIIRARKTITVLVKNVHIDFGNIKKK